MFADRRDAGCRLAERLEHLRGPDTVVLGLPRGGVRVAAEIARVLDAPLDVLVVRKLGAPEQPELAIGAITDGQVFTNDRLIEALGVTPEYLAAETARQRTEVQRGQTLYRGGRPGVPLNGRVLIVVDDGVATGATVRVGLQALQCSDVEAIVLAVPVAPLSALDTLDRECDELVVLETPRDFNAVGSFYEDFREITNDEVVELLGGQLM